MSKLKQFLDEENTYFTTRATSIITRNNDTLTKGCVIYAGVLAFYTLLTLVTDQPRILRYMYYAFDFVHAALCAAVLLRPRDWKRSYKPVQGFCLLLEISLLGFFALEGAFTSRTEHSLYVPIAILLAQLLFIQKASTAITLNVCYTGIYAVLSYFYKIPSAFINDLYIAVATLISSCIGYYLIARSRISEGEAMRNFESVSKMDALTGLYNKSTFEDVCRRALKGGAKGLGMIVVDIDGFKAINDRFGYEAGDEVLARVGFAVKKTLCESDVAGRFGSDKFAVLMCPCEGEDVAARRVARINSLVSALTFSNADISVSCVSGVTVGRESDDLRALFIRAERAMRAAKEKTGAVYSIER